LKKYRVTQERVWVAKKKGCATGYGTTPRDAYRNASKKNKKMVDLLERLEHAEWLARDQQTRGEKYIDEIRKMQASRQADIDDGFVMMAMAYTGISNPREALRKIGLGITNGQNDAIQRVRKYYEVWLRDVGGKP